MPSTVIRSFAYDPLTKDLVVIFTSGPRYRYHEVPPATHVAMQAAFAKGEFFNAKIRDRFRFTQDS